MYLSIDSIVLLSYFLRRQLLKRKLLPTKIMEGKVFMFNSNTVMLDTLVILKNLKKIKLHLVCVSKGYIISHAAGHCTSNYRL